jgi:hypothetical protein
MYSRILFAAALLGAADALKLGAHQEAETAADTAVVEASADGAIDTTGQVDKDIDFGAKVEGTTTDETFGDVEFEASKDFHSGKTGEYTAEDGTTFVTGAKEKDSQTHIANDDGKLDTQSFSWDPSAGQIKKPKVDPPAPITPEPEPEVDPEPEPESESTESESESESTCSEEEDCGCCSTDVCPDLTYYDQQIAKQAADFMAHVRAGKAEVEYGLTKHETEEFEKDLTEDMLKDMA